jgi:hypothetical protein
MMCSLHQVKGDEMGGAFIRYGKKYDRETWKEETAFWRHRFRWEDTMKTERIVKKLGWFQLVQNRDQRRALMNTIMNLRV